MGFDEPPALMPTPSMDLPPLASPGPDMAPALLSQPVPQSLGVSAPGGAVPTDPRVKQFLLQGDDAMTRGKVQDAIDLWSRVFLIDLSNEDASRRIDAAREKQAQTAQALDLLLQDGIQMFDAGDYISSRGKFLDVLALSETDATARHYLNQIDGALSARESAAPQAAAPTDFLKEDYPAPAISAPPSGSMAEQDLSFQPGEIAAMLDEPTVAEEAESSAEEKPASRVDGRIVIGAAILLIAAIAFGAYQLLKSKPAPPPAPPPTTAAGTQPGPAPAIGEDLLAKAQALFDSGKADEALQILVSIPDTDPRHEQVLEMMSRFKSSPIPTPPAAAPSAASLDELRVSGLAALKSARYIDAVKALDPVVKAHPDDAESAQAFTRAREQLAALASAIRAYNEQDYESAIKLLWELRKKDAKNQDVEEFLFKSYFNDGIQSLQAGNFKKGGASFQEAALLRPSDAEAVRHSKFAKKYPQGSTDLLSRIYVKHAAARP
jgi:tetratricopeptide (TPR) repeat protein